MNKFTYIVICYMPFNEIVKVEIFDSLRDAQQYKQRYEHRHYNATCRIFKSLEMQ